MLSTDNNRVVINLLSCSYDEEEECVNQYECQPLENLEKIEIGNSYFSCIRKFGAHIENMLSRL